MDSQNYWPQANTSGWCRQAAAFTLRKGLMEAVPHLLAEEHIRCQPQLAVLALRLLLRLDVSGMPAELAQLQPALTEALANPQVHSRQGFMGCGLECTHIPYARTDTL